MCANKIQENGASIDNYICDKLGVNYFRTTIVSFYRRISQMPLVHGLTLTWFALVIFVVMVVWACANTSNVPSSIIPAPIQYNIINKRNTVPVSDQRPAIVWVTEGFGGAQETIFCPDKITCDVFDDKSRGINAGAYLFYGSNINFDNLPLPRQPESIIWALLHEESPRNVQELMHEKVLSLFNFSSTFSRHSDVPFPLQYLASLETVTSREYFVETAIKNSLLDEIAPVMYLQSDCETSTERDAYVEKLMEYIQIDSYGACLRNQQMPRKFREDYLNNLDDDDFLRFIARYKFVITIENGVCDDYVTEKFWRAIKVGTVPIYFGSSLIKDWMPNSRSAILLEDFPTPKILSEHIRRLMDDDNLYEEYLEHKIKDAIGNERLIQELKTRPYQTDITESLSVFQCFVCKKLYERKDKPEVNIVNKSHYNCPKPISALSIAVNPYNDWVQLWELSKNDAESIYNKVLKAK